MFIIVIGLVSYTSSETQNYYTILLSVTNIFKFVKTETVKYLALEIINELGPFSKWRTLRPQFLRFLKQSELQHQLQISWYNTQYIIHSTASSAIKKIIRKKKGNNEKWNRRIHPESKDTHVHTRMYIHTNTCEHTRYIRVIYTEDDHGN